MAINLYDGDDLVHSGAFLVEKRMEYCYFLIGKKGKKYYHPLPVPGLTTGR